jgi:DNA-directed RNA polymerase alpha subunit
VSELQEEFPKLSASFIDRSIDEVWCSPRTYNALRFIGVRTVRDLVTKTEKELRASRRGFGPKTIHEIRTSLAKLGLRLGMNFDT